MWTPLSSCERQIWETWHGVHQWLSTQEMDRDYRLVTKSCLYRNLPWGAGADSSITTQRLRSESCGQAELELRPRPHAYGYFCNNNKKGFSLCISLLSIWQRCFTENKAFSKLVPLFWKLSQFSCGRGRYFWKCWKGHSVKLFVVIHDSVDHGCWSGCHFVLCNFVFSPVLTVERDFALYSSSRCRDLDETLYEVLSLACRAQVSISKSFLCVCFDGDILKQRGKNYLYTNICTDEAWDWNV